MAGPFMIMKGGISTKPSILRILGLGRAAPAMAVERERPLDPEQTTAKTVASGGPCHDPGGRRGDEPSAALARALGYRGKLVVAHAPKVLAFSRHDRRALHPGDDSTARDVRLLHSSPCHGCRLDLDSRQRGRAQPAGRSAGAGDHRDGRARSDSGQGSSPPSGSCPSAVAWFSGDRRRSPPSILVSTAIVRLESGWLRRPSPARACSTPRVSRSSTPASRDTPSQRSPREFTTQGCGGWSRTKPWFSARGITARPFEHSSPTGGPSEYSPPNRPTVFPRSMCTISHSPEDRTAGADRSAVTIATVRRWGEEEVRRQPDRRPCEHSMAPQSHDALISRLIAELGWCQSGKCVR